MIKSDLAKALANEAKLPDHEAATIVRTLFDLVRQALVKGNRVEIRGLGSFKMKKYRGYKGRNPKSGESVTVEPKNLPVFKAGKDLKEQVNRD